MAVALIMASLAGVACGGGDEPLLPESTRTAVTADSLLVDPVWTATSSMSVARSWHTATKLANGKVLVAGGTNGFYVGSAELYDPATKTWSPAGTLGSARYGHTATLLPNGKVLVAGGDSGSPLASAELYDPLTNTWTATGAMATGRFFHAAVWLPTVGKVLVSGGFAGLAPVAGSELYDLATGTWTPAGAMSAPRQLHTITWVPMSSRALVAGGVGNDAFSPLAGVELFNPKSNTWMPLVASMTTGRHSYTATTLADGRILAVGGTGAGNTPLASAESYVPAMGAWTPKATMSAARTQHAAVLIPDQDRVIVVGGATTGGAVLASTELHDPSADTWTSAGSMTTPRKRHTATLLEDGDVLVAGGVDAANVVLASAELYTKSAPAEPVCVTIQRGVNGGVVEDTQIAADKPAKNYGALTQMLAGTVSGSARQSLLRFELGAIPAGATVLSATAHLDQAYGTEEPIAAHVHRVLAPWSEATVTWNGFAGAFDPAIAASFDSSLPSIAFDATALAQAWVNGPNHGMLIERAGSAGSSFVAISTSETSEKPSLDVCYVVAE